MLNRLKEIRSQYKISQEKLARALSVSNCMITHIENRYTKTYPKIRKAISKHFGVPESSIFDEQGWVIVDELSDILN